MLLVAISVALFYLRLWWRSRHALSRKGTWVRRIPPVIDTLLLISGAALIYTTHMTPINSSWLALKLFCLIGYILCGTLALTRAPLRQMPRFSVIASLFLITMLVLAVTKPILWQLG